MVAVSHVLKLFGTEKTIIPLNDNAGAAPEPLTTVPLKAPALRGVPSTPALRSSTQNPTSSPPLTRKSESNLRNSTFAGPSPRRAVYEDLLESEPGVVRQGDGWTSLSSGNSKAMGKPSSMASLRERALAFLRDEPMAGPHLGASSMRERHIVDLAQEVKRESAALYKGRPATPGGSVLMASNVKADQKRGGFFGKIKGFGRKKGLERQDDGVM
jgi:protein-serine/threonine kinase